MTARARSAPVPADTRPVDRPGAVRVGRRSALVLTLATVAGAAMFCWPLLASATPSSLQHSGDAPFMFMAVMPVLVVVVLAELSDNGMDSKALAMLGVLSAINAALRPLGAGTAGIETVFFLLVLAGRVYGPGFGFVLGCTSLFTSALVTAGVGPWLPFQMVASAWIGMGAGLLPRRVRGRAEIAMLVGYSILAAYGFGLLMNLWFWPFSTGIQVDGSDAGLSYVPGAPLLENLQRFGVYTAITSTFSWDTGRAITNTVALLVLGPAVLATLRRASRRASYGAAVGFGPDRDPAASRQR